jgi:hypothetical protein
VYNEKLALFPIIPETSEIPRTRDPESRTPGTGPINPDPRPRTKDPGTRYQDPGPRTTDPGHWTDKPGPQTTDKGPRNTEPGPRTTDKGPQTTDKGPRTTDKGPRTPTAARLAHHLFRLWTLRVILRGVLISTVSRCSWYRPSDHPKIVRSKRLQSRMSRFVVGELSLFVDVSSDPRNWH